MQFRTATTGDKLRFLADALETEKIASQFSQRNTDYCVVGIGDRLDGSGRLAPNDMWRNRTEPFAKKYGVTLDDTESLFIAAYEDLKIGERNRAYSDVTPKIAARVLRKLAKKYDAGRGTKKQK